MDSIILPFIWSYESLEFLKNMSKLKDAGGFIPNFKMHY